MLHDRLPLRLCDGERVMSVSMNPGATQFTVTLRLPISRASDLLKPITPAFAAA